MCGRFSQAYTWGEIYAFSQPLTEPASPARNLQARYNIAATTTIDILVKTDAGRELWKARWGLIPPWHKGTAKQIKPHINSRVEGIDTNSLFKRAYVKNRCIIPASGFYEWTGEEKNKTPHYISAKDGAILAFAGIWERWRDENGEEIISASVTRAKRTTGCRRSTPECRRCCILMTSKPGWTVRPGRKCSCVRRRSSRNGSSIAG